MTFDQIQYFIAIAEQDTYFDAAEELNISQSALSKQIIKLEKELGVALIDRSHRKASLTPAGETFYQDALILQRQHLDMLTHLKKYQASDSHSLRIGTLPILTQYDLTILFREFTKSHPNIHLIIDEVEENDLKKGLLSDHYDLIICREQIIAELNLLQSDTGKKRSHTLDLFSVFLAEDELVAVLPADSPLNAPVSLPELKTEPFLLMNRYTSVYRICQNLFENARIHPSILRTARVESIISAVAIGEGISLLPYSNFKLFQHKHIKTLSLEPKVQIPVVIIGNKKRMNSPVCQEFIHYITNTTR